MNLPVRKDGLVRSWRPNPAIRPRFGLTPGETRVLGEIIGGNGLPAAAARLKITQATARTHAYRIFEKTGTNRQAELIRRFFETSLFAGTASELS
jgi:DNA-binding CsgD family transcriptional regulator